MGGTDGTNLTDVIIIEKFGHLICEVFSKFINFFMLKIYFSTNF